MRIIIVALFLVLLSKPALAGCIDNPRTCNKNLLCAYAETSYADGFFWNRKNILYMLKRQNEGGLAAE